MYQMTPWGKARSEYCRHRKSELKVWRMCFVEALHPPAEREIWKTELVSDLQTDRTTAQQQSGGRDKS